MWVITARSAKKQKCIGSVSLLSRESSSSLFSPRFPAEGIAAQVQKWSHARRDSLPTATVARNEKTLGASPPSLGPPPVIAVGARERDPTWLRKRAWRSESNAMYEKVDPLSPKTLLWLFRLDNSGRKRWEIEPFDDFAPIAKRWRIFLLAQSH